MSIAFDRMATRTVSVLRPPALSGGKRGQPVLHLADLKCWPIDPVGTQTAQRFGLQGPYTQFETRTETLDIARGDILVDGELRYTVAGIMKFDWRDSAFLTLLLERDRA